MHRDHPWVANSIYRAFCEARDIALEALPDSDALHVALPFLLDHVEETWRVFGKHYWEYGIAPNRPAFEAMGRYMFEQGLAPRVVTPEEMFAGVRIGGADRSKAPIGRMGRAQAKPISGLSGSRWVSLALYPSYAGQCVRRIVHKMAFVSIC